MRHLDHRVQTPAWGGVVAVLIVATHLPACSRTGLDVSSKTRRDGTEAPRDGSVVNVDTGTTAPHDPQTSDAGAKAPPGTATPPDVEVPTARHCAPLPETCNGKDDDCNGHVDDAIAPLPCNGGGSQYCVAGHFTACPNRCDACVPGSERVCFHAYCTYWAVQECAADGKSFGICRERVVPPECAGVADRFHESTELERCCVDNGYCCHDEFDLDHDGDRGEMLGTCDEVSCHP